MPGVSIFMVLNDIALLESTSLNKISEGKSEFETCLKLEVHIIKLSPPINGDVDSVSIVISDFD
jgi:hypothetical protein